MFLYAIEAGDLFYDVLHAVEELGLSSCVQLCIPEIVLLEVKHHMLDKFKSTIDSLNSKINEVKRSLGDLVDIHYELKGNMNEKDYSQYLDTITSEFLSNPKNKTVIVNCPRTDKTIENIMESAISSIPPFVKAKAGGKEYSDAGLKDALIWETIKCCDEKELVIFVTKDRDFSNVEKRNVNFCSSVAEVEKLLIENLNIDPDKLFIGLLTSNDSYLLNQIMNEAQFYNYKSVAVEKVFDMEFIKDEADRETLNVICDIRIDGTLFEFTIRYDFNAKELVDVFSDEYIN